MLSLLFLLQPIHRRTETAVSKTDPLRNNHCVDARRINDGDSDGLGLAFLGGFGGLIIAAAVVIIVDTQIRVEECSIDEQHS